MGTDDFDSSGKNKPNDARSRSSLLIISLLVGVCIGIVFSERVYVHYQVSIRMTGLLTNTPNQQPLAVSDLTNLKNLFHIILFLPFLACPHNTRSILDRKFALHSYFCGTLCPSQTAPTVGSCNKSGSNIVG